jgi:hypothetical protein
MRVEIRGIIDYGKPESERIIIDVLENCNIGHYMIMQTNYTHHERPSNKIKTIFIFPSQPMQKGDTVILYTKEGKNSMLEKGGKIEYSFYWNMDKCIWNNMDDCVLIVHFDSLTHKKINDVASCAEPGVHHKLF